MPTKRGTVYPVTAQVKVDTLNIHSAPHLDEIAVLVLLFYFGETFFPGVRQAILGLKIIFDDYVNWTRSDFVAKRILPIGTGFGTWFNEHLKVGGRIGGVCAATMAARYLRVDGLPALRRLLQEVLLCDTTDKCRPTMLASLIKVAHRVAAAGSTEVIAWAMTAIHAIIAHETQIIRGQAMRPAVRAKRLIEWYEAWFAKKMQTVTAGGGTIDSRIKDYMLNFMHKSVRERDSTVTELAHIVEAMTCTGRTSEQIRVWLDYIFEALYADQCDFFAEVDRQESIEPLKTRALLDDEETHIFISIIENATSQNAHRAARYWRNIRRQKNPEDAGIYGVTLVHTSTGHMHTFSDREIANRMVRCGLAVSHGLQSVTARMVRSLELKKQGCTSLPSFITLDMEGDGPDKKWHYFGGDAQQLLNGSPTHPKDPTQIMLDDMTELLWNGYHPALLKGWLQTVLR